MLCGENRAANQSATKEREDEEEEEADEEEEEEEEEETKHRAKCDQALRMVGATSARGEREAGFPSAHFTVCSSGSQTVG